MKREGRQHGMVRTYRVLPSAYNPRPGFRSFGMLDSPPTAGLFTKAPSKPTNHSKFTGKCGKPRCVECHMHPASKSKDKTKGSQKERGNDLELSHRLITWRVVEGRMPGLNFTSSSATGLLDHIAYEHEHDYEHDDELYEDEEETEIASDGVGDNNQHSCVGEGNYDGSMSYCDVGLLLSQIEGEEGWCLVGQNVVG